MSLLLCLAAIGLVPQRPSAALDLAAQIKAAEARVTDARPRTIAAAEAEGASYPRVEADTRPGSSAPARTCMLIKSDHIVFPASTGGFDPSLLSGDFSAVSISFGWDKTYELAKVPFEVRHPDVIGAGLWLRLIRLDAPGDAPPLSLPGFNARTMNSGLGFFATFPKFPTPGRWMMIASAGANWGCFVLDRPLLR
ncbi:MAG TPA: hypothetical protein VFV78_05955 [Vicinamibacterales bacterium]|nr:hypothetical protein [Vicinamibacterales bacterium]